MFKVTIIRIFQSGIRLIPHSSQSSSRTYQRIPVVDRLPACLLYIDFKTWRSQSVPKVDAFIVHKYRPMSYFILAWFQPAMELESRLSSVGMRFYFLFVFLKAIYAARHYIQPYGWDRLWHRHCGKLFYALRLSWNLSVPGRCFLLIGQSSLINSTGLPPLRSYERWWHYQL